MEQILEYLKNRFDPLSIIVYGSYADGSNNADSDFDALVISGSHRSFHDVSMFGGVRLDVFVHPAERFAGEFDCDEFAGVYDGVVVLDKTGMGAALKAQVVRHIDGRPRKTGEELQAEIEWCGKMLLRSRRGDAEGMFRWHWLLTDSLEIYCDAMGRPYFGPKKSLKWMEREHPDDHVLYKNALSDLSAAPLEKWVQRLYELK